MVKAGGAKKSDGGQSMEEVALEAESKRLRGRALSQGVLSRRKSSSEEILRPSKQILKCDGRDIVKKGHRKTKFLFAFPGLFAPMAGGKLGELSQLDTRNPVMYIDFPQGRLKLFGTIVYPSNKYLTLHVQKGAGNIACEDCFETMVVFSEAWWVGTKEGNPDEFKLEMPEELLKATIHRGFDFTGGAGRPPPPLGPFGMAPQPATASSQQTGGEPPKAEAKAEAPVAAEGGPAANESEEARPRRLSMRTAGKSFRFKESPSDVEDEGGSDDEDDKSSDADGRGSTLSGKGLSTRNASTGTAGVSSQEGGKQDELTSAPIKEEEAASVEDTAMKQAPRQGPKGGQEAKGDGKGKMKQGSLLSMFKKS